ncbi:MAG TPA: ribosome silencing factor [Chitinophagales bacterium]|nr:ribosome silencing factor [Chitinophagales bacterium]
MSTKTLKTLAKGKPKLAVWEEVIVDAILDKKGEEVVSLDLRKIGDAVTDIFIICHATSKVQVKAIADNVDRKVKQILGENPWHSEGFENFEWVILDYIDIVVHVFIKEKRNYYQLEDLWQDAERTDYD